MIKGPPKNWAAVVVIVLGTVSAMSFASETVKGAKKDLEEFKTEMSVKLQEIEKKLEDLRDKSKTKSSEVQQKAVKELEETRDKLRTQVKEMKDDGKASWKKLKTKMAKAVDNLNAKIQKALGGEN